MSLRPSTVSLEDFDKLATKKENKYSKEINQLALKENDII